MKALHLLLIALVLCGVLLSAAAQDDGATSEMMDESTTAGMEEATTEDSGDSGDCDGLIDCIFTFILGLFGA